MTSLNDTDIERIARGVIARTLPKAEWTHAARLRRRCGSSRSMAMTRRA